MAHPEAPIPAHTVVGVRPQSEPLGVQEFHLTLLNTDRAGTSFAVQDGELKLGKAPENDIVIDDPTVSRNHLILKRQHDRFTVQDLGSTNGTFIDGAQVREGYLKPGMVLEVGDVQLRFHSKVAAVKIAPLSEDKLGTLVGHSLPMRQIFALLQRIAPTESTLLLEGETGSGKGAAAKLVHELSPRAKGPFVVFDCAAASESLIESEIFGHEKGAFTGAVAQRQGCLERSDGGTLFLDEIDDLALDLQPKLLRAIEERKFQRLGTSNAPISFDSRVIAASKKDLWAETQAGRFREDLYFRLSVFTVSLPALRDRREDIPLLVDALAAEPLWRRLAPEVRGQMQTHAWPGNVRELRNAVERAKRMVDMPELSTGPLLRATGPALGASPGGEVLPVEFDGPFKECKDELIKAFEREYLKRLLERVKGNVAKAAREASLDRKYLYSLLHKYGMAQTGEE
jgi:DNA-binding NtrC family response regulator